MKTINNRLDELTKKISSPTFLETNGLGNEVNFYIFDYDPEDEYIVREYIEMIKSKKNICIKDFNIYDIILEKLEEEGFLEQTFELEKQKGTEFINETIVEALEIGSANDQIINYFNNKIDKNDIVFITGIGQVFSIIRTHTLLSNLKKVMKNNPLILFYPGNFAGTSSSLFNKLKSEDYYRAFQIVGRR